MDFTKHKKETDHAGPSTGIPSTDEQKKALDDLILKANVHAHNESNPAGFMVRYLNDTPYLYLLPWAAHRQQEVRDSWSPVAVGWDAARAFLNKHI